MEEVGWGAEVREGDENPSPPNIYYGKEPPCSHDLRLRNLAIPPNVICAGDASESLETNQFNVGRTNIDFPQVLLEPKATLSDLETKVKEKVL